MRVFLATLSSMILLLVPSVALASGLPSGVHVDPGSPAGKQYALPISSTRSMAAGQPNGGSSNAPAFGVGITPSQSGGASASQAPATGGTTASTGQAAGTGQAGNHTRRSRSHRHHKTSAQLAASSSPGPPLPPSAISSNSGAGSSGWIALILGGALVLLVGGAGGFALRRRLTS
ncbi:MAG TPA: hypothetical protein VFP55_13790 [Solirubrobacteraceae bacterium]|nr:hypothetical protein [Solirubrobacteraceae bacterium]